MEGLFKMLYQYVCDIWGEAVAGTPVDSSAIPAHILERMLAREDSAVRRRLVKYIFEKGYGPKEVQPEQIVTDYIAGMTDAYALKTYEELYWI